MSKTKDLRDLVAECRVTDGTGFSLKGRDTGTDGGIGLTKSTAGEALQHGVDRLAELQALLYANPRWSILCLFQAMDAAGKDSAIKHVFSGVNPQGCQVESFAAPSTLERHHDFLWRHVLALPRRGRIGIHNRSWYEEVLAPRVHPEILHASSLPHRLISDDIWTDRLEDIAAFERYLSRQGTVVLKFYLHVGQDEQRKRLLARIDEPDKNWKFREGDLDDRARWDDYRHAYEDAIRATAAPHAPWFIIPSDRKWLTRLIVAEAIIEAMEALDLRYPEVTAEQKAGLARARDRLRAEGA
ncbi:polyphosphate kinase 2 family protein [Roseomonas sp. CCTCC AB2023176]|uniref:polyphosphate kinase 2 family protein n=1 Tax=Roseomonas sp. CCTCC AB2023176 TaxID=3342640 RepID=UPI0035E144D3